MPNTRDIRNRIKSVKSTQQITKAMQMVAAAKVRRAQERVIASRPYAHKIEAMLKQVAGYLGAEEIRDPLMTVRPVKNTGILIITSDKGLAGSYNTNVIRQGVSTVRQSREDGGDAKLWLVGNKAINFFKHSNFNVEARYSRLPAIPTYAEARMIMESLADAYREGTIDRVQVVYTRFVSMISYKPTELDLLPLPRLTEMAGNEPRPLYYFEPSAEEVLLDLLPKTLETVIYQALLESAASELASRMAAMSSASKNAQEMVQALTLVYNKVRQSGITREILEIVGGAEALRG